MKRKMVSALLCATMVAGGSSGSNSTGSRQETDRCYHADQGSPEMEPGWREHEERAGGSRI